MTIPNIPKRGMPVSIITGFLGSGKTTLLNQILQNHEEAKFAVLVNEFGDINIDSQLLVSMEDEMVELNNGCICCTINDGLVEAIYRILEREEPVDYLIVETTGIADPLPIILTFLGTEFRDLTRLDSVITLVDSELFTPAHFDSQAALRQIAYSDVVILNKTDLATLEKLEELETYIKTTKVGARVLRSQYGKVPLPLILDVGLTPIQTYEPEVHEHDHDHHHHHHSDHLENDGFISISLESDRPFDIQKFEYFLLEQMPTDVFRAKGILWFAHAIDCCTIFQLSGGRYDLQKERWRKNPSNQIVLIGRNINYETIYQQLKDCLVT